MNLWYLEGVVVGILIFAAIVQTIIHLVSARVLLRQDSESPIGKAIAYRELTLGLSKASMIALYALLFLAVVPNYDVEQWPITLVALPIIGVTSLIAVAFGLRFMVTLSKENWGDFDERTKRIVEVEAQQAATGAELAETGRVQAETTVTLGKAHQALTERSGVLGRNQEKFNDDRQRWDRDHGPDAP